MKPTKYVSECATTEKDLLGGLKLDQKTTMLLASTMYEAINVGARIDAIKKHIIYGKGLPDLKAMTAYDYSIPKGGLNVSQEKSRLLHAILGKVGETAELAEELAEHIFNDVSLDSAHVAEELGDSMWYDTIIIRTLYLRLESVMSQNIAKLKARYKGEGFTSDNAINRDHATEQLAVQESKNGLYDKFTVERTDGTELPDTAKFLVLRLDSHGHDLETQVARAAARDYALAMGNTALYDALTNLD